MVVRGRAFHYPRISGDQFRCQPDNVPGATIVATSARSFLHNAFAFGAPTALIVVQAPADELLTTVIDGLQLALVHPST